MLGAEPDALDIDGLREVPDFLGGVDGVCIIGMHYARVIEHNVDTTPRVDVLNKSLNVRLFRDITGLPSISLILNERRTRSTCLELNLIMRGDDLLELCRRSLETRARYVGHENVGTLFSEEDACFKPDTSEMIAVSN